MTEEMKIIDNEKLENVMGGKKLLDGCNNNPANFRMDELNSKDESETDQLSYIYSLINPENEEKKYLPSKVPQKID